MPSRRCCRRRRSLDGDRGNGGHSLLVWRRVECITLCTARRWARLGQERCRRCSAFREHRREVFSRQQDDAPESLTLRPSGDTFRASRQSRSMIETWQVLRRWVHWTCFAVAVSACRPAVAREARVVPNDNRAPAGSLQGGVLTLHLEAHEARWFPDGDGAPSIVMQFFGEV